MDNHINLNQPLMGDSSYNMRMREEQQNKQMNQRVSDINKLRKEAEGNKDMDNIVVLMNFIEKLLHACGGESKANFVDISRDFMKILTRVPLKANLHQFLPDDDKNNPRYHKVVTQILIGIPQILGIRWVEVDGGTILILSIKRQDK